MLPKTWIWSEYSDFRSPRKILGRIFIIKTITEFVGQKVKSSPLIKKVRVVKLVLVSAIVVESYKMSEDDGTDGESTSSSTEGESAPKRFRYACTFRPNSNTFTWAKVSMKGPSFAYGTRALVMLALLKVALRI